MIWFQGLEESGQMTDWDTFVRALLVSFGPNPYDDPMEALTKFRQVGSVKEYKAQFETLSNRLSGLLDAYKLSYFLSGVKDEIRIPMRMFNPSNLTTAYSLSKLQEQNNISKKTNKPIFSQPQELTFPKPIKTINTNPQNKSKLDEGNERKGAMLPLCC